MLIARQQRGHGQQVVAVDQAVHPARILPVARLCGGVLGLAGLLRHPVLRCHVLGGQHHLARLQAHALSGFQTF